MKRLLSILLALGLVLSFSLLTAVPVQGADLYVPSVSYPTINSALAVATAGDTIYVAAGTYNEDITLENGVDVLGAGANVTTINGTGTKSVVSAGNVILAGTVFDGFTITGGGNTNYGGGMYINGSSLTVSNCIFTGNHANNRGGGMCIINGASPVVANCVFANNTANSLTGGGIYTDASSSPSIINNTIVSNTAPNGGGIYSDNSSSTTITNNIIVGNTANTSGGGIYAAGTPPTINYNDVFGNTAPTGADYYGCSGGTGAKTVDPDFETGYNLSAISPCIDVGDNAAVPAGFTTDFEGDPRIFDGDNDGTDTVDMGADEYYVAPPPSPHRTVGGEVYPIDKTALLLPWLIAGAALILTAGGLILIRRQAR
jgi:parallel beta-helix repeat protein